MSSHNTSFGGGFLAPSGAMNGTGCMYRKPFTVFGNKWSSKSP